MYKWIELGVKKLGYLYTQVVGGDLTRNSTVIYPYGSKGNAPKNNLTLLLNIDGSVEKTVNIELNDLKDIALKEGEYLIGNFLKNNTIKFDENGNIIIKGDKIILEGPVEIKNTLKVNDSVEMKNTLKVDKTIDAGDEIINGKGVTLGGHTHPFPYNAGPTPSSGVTETGQG